MHQPKRSSSPAERIQGKLSSPGLGSPRVPPIVVTQSASHKWTVQVIREDSLAESVASKKSLSRTIDNFLTSTKSRPQMPRPIGIKQVLGPNLNYTLSRMGTEDSGPHTPHYAMHTLNSLHGQVTTRRISSAEHKEARAAEKHGILLRRAKPTVNKIDRKCRDLLIKEKGDGSIYVRAQRVYRHEMGSQRISEEEKLDMGEYAHLSRHDCEKDEIPPMLGYSNSQKAIRGNTDIDSEREKMLSNVQFDTSEYEDGFPRMQDNTAPAAKPDKSTASNLLARTAMNEYLNRDLHEKIDAQYQDLPHVDEDPASPLTFPHLREEYPARASGAVKGVSIEEEYSQKNRPQGSLDVPWRKSKQPSDMMRSAMSGMPKIKDSSSQDISKEVSFKLRQGSENPLSQSFPTMNLHPNINTTFNYVNTTNNAQAWHSPTPVGASTSLFKKNLDIQTLHKDLSALVKDLNVDTLERNLSSARHHNFVNDTKSYLLTPPKKSEKTALREEHFRIFTDGVHDETRPSTAPMKGLSSQSGRASVSVKNDPRLYKDALVNPQAAKQAVRNMPIPEPAADVDIVIL